MQLTHAREMAEDIAKEGVREVVVTVPGWWSQSERAAMLDAIELAGLKSIGLVNDGTAGQSSRRLAIMPRGGTSLTITRLLCCMADSRRQLRHDAHLPS